MRFAPPICCLFCTRIPACVGVGETHRILFHGSFRIWTVNDWARTSGCCDGGWAYDFYVFRPDDQNTLKRTHPRALWQRTWVDSTDTCPYFRFGWFRLVADFGSSSRLSYDTTGPLSISAWSYFTQRREASSGLPARQRVTHQHQTTSRRPGIGHKGDRDSHNKFKIRWEGKYTLRPMHTHTFKWNCKDLFSLCRKAGFGKSYIYLFLS